MRLPTNPTPRIALAAQEKKNRALVNASVFNFKDIENPSEEVQLLAVKRMGSMVQYIDHPSEAVQLAAVFNDTHALRYIDQPTKMAQLKATEQDGYTIQFINNPDVDVQLSAVGHTGSSIRFIDKPSEEVQLKAVEDHGDNIDYIDHPTVKTVARAIAVTPSIVFAEEFVDVITPSVLDAIHPGLAQQVETIKLLTTGVTARAEMLAEVYPLLLDNTVITPEHLGDTALPGTLSI